MELLNPSSIRRAKDLFFDRMNIQDDGSQRREIVYARAAFINAFRKHGKVVDLAKAVHKDHSTIVHYCKVHEQQMAYSDYKQLFNKASELKRELVDGEEFEELTIAKLLQQVEKLSVENSKLKEENINLMVYKEKYFKLKELI